MAIKSIAIHTLLVVVTINMQLQEKEETGTQIMHTFNRARDSFAVMAHTTELNYTAET